MKDFVLVLGDQRLIISGAESIEELAEALQERGVEARVEPVLPKFELPKGEVKRLTRPHKTPIIDDPNPGNPNRAQRRAKKRGE